MTNNQSRINLILRDANLTPKEKDIIVGTILGDASIVNRIKSSTLEKNSGLKYNYGNKTYADFVFEGLKNIINRKSPYISIRTDPRYNKDRISYSFDTFTLPFLTPYAKLFLKPYFLENKGRYYNRKVLPDFDYLFELITPRALAYWIMDDGQEVIRGGVTLCTDNFTEEEVLLLKSVLEKKFNFTCSIHKKKANKVKKEPLFNKNIPNNLIKNTEDPEFQVDSLVSATDLYPLVDSKLEEKRIYYRIYISGKDLPLLNSLVSEYFCPSMLYKIHFEEKLFKPLSLSKKNIKAREERKRIRLWKVLPFG